MDLELYLVPNRTPTIQLYARTGGASVGSPISGAPDGTFTYLYRFNVTAVPNGDYEFAVSGVAEIPGPRTPMRKTSTGVFYASSWWELDYVVPELPEIPAAVTGLCNVGISVVGAHGQAISGVTVAAKLEGINQTVNNYITANIVDTAVTDNSGNCMLTLIRKSQFTRGGIYRITATTDDNVVFHNRLVRIPDLASVNLEDIPELT